MTNIIAPPPIWPLELNSPMSMSYVVQVMIFILVCGLNWWVCPKAHMPIFILGCELNQMVGLSERLICQSYEPGMVRAYQVEAERDKLLNFIRPIRFGGPINN